MAAPIGKETMASMTELSKALQGNKERKHAIRIHIRKDKNGQCYGVVVGGNGRSVWNTESYVSKHGVFCAIALLNQVLASPGTMIIDEVRESTKHMFK